MIDYILRNWNNVGDWLKYLVYWLIEMNFMGRSCFECIGWNFFIYSRIKKIKCNLFFVLFLFCDFFLDLKILISNLIYVNKWMNCSFKMNDKIFW